MSFFIIAHASDPQYITELFGIKHPCVVRSCSSIVDAAELKEFLSTTDWSQWRKVSICKTGIAKEQEFY